MSRAAATAAARLRMVTHVVEAGIVAAMDSRTVLRLLMAAGWVEVAQRGSHKQLRHPGRPGKVTVPHPRKDLPLATLRSIERQSGVRLRPSP